MFTDTKNTTLITCTTGIPQKNLRKYERCKLEKVWRPLKRFFALQSSGSPCKHCQNSKNHNSIKYQSIPNNVALNNAASTVNSSILPYHETGHFPKTLMVDLPQEDKSAIICKDLEQEISLERIAPLPVVAQSSLITIPQETSLLFANEEIQVAQDSISEITDRTLTPTPFLQSATVNKTPVTTRNVTNSDGYIPIPLLDKCNTEHCIYGSNCQHNHLHQQSLIRETVLNESEQLPLELNEEASRQDIESIPQRQQESFEEVLESFRVLALTEALNDEQSALRHWLAKHSQTLV